MLSIKHTRLLGLVSLVVAWGFDFLFWQKSPGISFFVFVVLCLLGGGLISWWEGKYPARTSLWLLIPILFFSIMSFIRQEPFTLMISYLGTLACLAILTMTWTGGKWLFYSLSDYGMGIARLAGSALSQPILLFFVHKPAGESGELPDKTTSQMETLELADKAPGEAGDVSGETSLTSQPTDEEIRDLPTQNTLKRKSGRAGAILRGILIALPVIAVLSALLASADPIFSKDLNAFLSLFRIENLGEYIFRLVYILIGAYLLIGLYLHAIGPSRNEKLIGLDKPWLQPFLGWMESSIVLGSVDVLFAFFVGIQARYFFGGQANITTSGYTFAEYARRGFNELVAVAVVSLVLILALSSVTRRETRIQQRVFKALEVGLVILVGIILVSAYQRLMMYESAYGFTRIRTYTHVFMIWLGVLLALTVMLDLLSNLRRFALAALLVCLAFGANLSLLNVDAFIAGQNLARAKFGSTLDAAYLGTLSDDVVPQLVNGFKDNSLSAGQRNDIGAVLSCRLMQYELDPGGTSWQSFAISRSTARELLSENQAELHVYPVTILENGAWQVSINGENRLCSDLSSMN